MTILVREGLDCENQGSVLYGKLTEKKNSVGPCDQAVHLCRLRDVWIQVLKKGSQGFAFSFFIMILVVSTQLLYADGLSPHEGQKNN
jgi:hypothetical protein